MQTTIADNAARAIVEQKMKDDTLKKFFGLVFLNQADSNKYEHLLKEFRKSYTNKQRNLYPEDLTSMFEVMRTVEIKKVKAKNPPPK